MPLEPSLPNLVVSVAFRTNGKANGMSNRHLRRLKEVCLGKGFLVVAFSVGGDSAYEDFLKPPYDVISSAECQQMTFGQIVEAMSSHNKAFVTNFLHFMRYLRNCLSIHPLKLYHRLTPVTTESLSKVEPIGNCLERKSNGWQLKDAISLYVLSLKNLVTLLAYGNSHEPLYFLPVVLW
jgi:hypothetical protein